MASSAPLTASDRDITNNLFNGFQLKTKYDYDTQYDSSGNLLFSKLSKTTINGDVPHVFIYQYNNLNSNNVSTGDLTTKNESGGLGSSETDISYEYTPSGLLTVSGDTDATYSSFNQFGEAGEVTYNNLTDLIIGGNGSMVEYFGYDNNGYLVSYSDEYFHTTIYTVDILGHRTKTTQPTADGSSGTGPQSYSTYNSFGNVTSTTDADNHQTQFVYDKDQRLIETINPDGSIITNQYDSNGNLVTQTDGMGNETRIHIRFAQSSRLNHLAEAALPCLATTERVKSFRKPMH